MQSLGGCLGDRFWIRSFKALCWQNLAEAEEQLGQHKKAWDQAFAMHIQKLVFSKAFPRKKRAVTVAFYIGARVPKPVDRPWQACNMP